MFMELFFAAVFAFKKTGVFAINGLEGNNLLVH